MSSHTKWPEGLPLTKSLGQPFIGLKHSNQLPALRCTSFRPCGTFSWEYTSNIPCSLTGPRWSRHPRRPGLAQNRSGESQTEFLCEATESSPQAWIFALGPREGRSAGPCQLSLDAHVVFSFVSSAAVLTDALTLVPSPTDRDAMDPDASTLNFLKAVCRLSSSPSLASDFIVKVFTLLWMLPLIPESGSVVVQQDLGRGRLRT
uniref:Oxidative stress-responsive serine-rich protein 1 n=1 Tax=Sus scrofa TaxID=9823 RepID=A0A481CX96_PIG